MEIKQYCEKNLINADSQYLEDNIIIVDEKIYVIIKPKEIEGEQKLFDEDFKLILDQLDFNTIEQYEADYFLFYFGEQWYYYSTKLADIELNIFKYIGLAKQEIVYPEYSFLGIHTGFELCNGSQMPEEWIKKAKFLCINSIATCELNTLAGSLKFQDQCDKQKIKSIIGETITVKKDNELYELKLYVTNDIGWQNLLNINSQINVVNQSYVDEDFVLSHSEGLIVVICSDKKLSKQFISKIHNANFISCFFQIDLVEYQSNERDRAHLLNIQDYLKNWQKFIKPILICDTYYLDQEDHEIKVLLNKVGKVGFKYQSKDQYFKTLDEISKQFSSLHNNEINIKTDGQQCIELFEQCIESTYLISHNCNFKIKKDEIHLPEYEMNAEQKKKFKTNKDLFYSLIADGFEKRLNDNVENTDIYYDRFATEVEIIERGHLIDYFLILWDIVKWCKDNNIEVGPGRGSAASSLVVYLLNITQLDPIRYKLIFERFLNEARIPKLIEKNGQQVLSGGSMPDIDIDFESEYRDKVKQYIQEKYTFDNVCCIGTFNNFKIKSCIKDLSREMNVDYSEANFISSLINKDYEDGSFIDLFKCSLNEPKLKTFINKNHKLVNAMRLILFQPKVKSVHAAGVIITPKYKNRKTLYDLMPVRVEDGILIAEWDKLDVDATGFLKEDILGLQQLDKINGMKKLIKKNRGIDIDLNEIDICDKNVYKYFQQGLTEDVFQFNTDVQKKYMIDLQPDTIEELTAANALNRPGPMESGAQTLFIDIKNGKKEAEYDFLLEDVTKDTLGLYAFQEQVMQAYKIITECTSAESDAFRKLTSKIWEGQQDDEKIIKAKKIFFDAYISKGVTDEYCQKVWDKLIKFSGYGFNIAHSASYAVLGYYSLWFKVYYPLEFWTVSLQWTKEELISPKLAEIDKEGIVQVIAPDINNSHVGFQCDLKTDKIYWSITSVKFAGEVAVSGILEEREKNGKFKSLKDFVSRINKSKVNKRVVCCLIIAGCFDEIEKITTAQGRLNISIKYFKEILNEEIPDNLKGDVVIKETYWQLKAKEICGYGYIDYKSFYKNLPKKMQDNYKYFNAKQIHQLTIENIPNDEVLVMGNINSIDEKSSVNGKYVKVMLDDNNTQFQVVIWNDTYMKCKEQLKENCILAITCKIKKPDKYYSNNGLQAYSSAIFHFL